MTLDEMENEIEDDIVMKHSEKVAKKLLDLPFCATCFTEEALEFLGVTLTKEDLNAIEAKLKAAMAGFYRLVLENKEQDHRSAINKIMDKYGVSREDAEMMEATVWESLSGVAHALKDEFPYLPKEYLYSLAELIMRRNLGIARDEDVDAIYIM